jgi:hypothetical protein
MAGRGDRAAAADGALARGLRPTRERSVAGQRRAHRAFIALECLSFVHSCVYLSLLICAFAAGEPQPETFVLGMAHGVLWIFMSLVCIAAARARIVPLRLAVAVAVLGGIGPFFGSAEFIRVQRRGEAPAVSDEEFAPGG